jgi:hypothetical protein
MFADPLPPETVENLTKTWRLLARILQEFGLGVFGHVFVNLEISEGSRAFGVDEPLWNPLSIEVSYLLEELEVLQKSRTALSRRSEGPRHH